MQNSFSKGRAYQYNIVWQHCTYYDCKTACQTVQLLIWIQLENILVLINAKACQHSTAYQCISASQHSTDSQSNRACKHSTAYQNNTAWQQSTVCQYNADCQHSHFC